MKRFLIHVSTHWCGEEDTFRAVAESESDLWDLAEQLAYDNFYSYGHDQDIAEEEGYDPDEMEEGDWDELWSRVDENAYYSSSIEECEDDEEWNEYSGEIYGFPAQAAMVVEECSELTNAICKFRRGRVGEDDIITEIADVMIMCEQLSNYFGKEKVELEKERKLERLKERLSKYTD